VPNKATIEREALAARILAEQAGKPGKKLGKEVLDDFMQLFTGLAAFYQPLPPGQLPGPNQSPDEAKFEKYARFAIDCAKELAGYQSPRLKAVLLSQETAPGGPAQQAGGMVMGSPSVLSPQQAYKLLRDNDTIDVTPTATAKAIARKVG
jgi:hypothetical protein